MFGMIYEINEFIKREKWECSKYFEKIRALVEILLEGEVENERINSTKKIKLTDKIYWFETNSGFFYNLLISRNLNNKKFTQMKKIFKVSKPIKKRSLFFFFFLGRNERSFRGI
ncbi:hypothetical protein CDIK_3935 [Cucumispora dikerogammari]|nr:hypothetical protein CDIK_3935 [Cucumispora dikerogammari]